MVVTVRITGNGVKNESSISTNNFFVSGVLRQSRFFFHRSQAHIRYPLRSKWPLFSPPFPLSVWRWWRFVDSRCGAKQSGATLPVGCRLLPTPPTTLSNAARANKRPNHHANGEGFLSIDIGLNLLSHFNRDSFIFSWFEALVNTADRGFSPVGQQLHSSKFALI